jgi:hypothetical protein
MKPNWYGSRHNQTVATLIGMPLHFFNTYSDNNRSSAPAMNSNPNWSIESVRMQPFFS